MSSTSSPLSNFYTHWMKLTPELHTCTLAEICFPATHDSATGDLTEQWLNSTGNKIVTTLEDLTNPKGYTALAVVTALASAVGNLGLWIEQQAAKAIKGVSKTTNRSITEQLNDGIRCLDLRVYSDQSDNFFAFHGTNNLGLIGTSMSNSAGNGVLQQINQWVSATPGEILYITLGHCNNFASTDYLLFLQTIARSGLTAYAVPPTTLNVFSQTYIELMGTTGQAKVFLVVGDEALYTAATALASNPYWGPDYSPPDNDANSHIAVKGAYTDTDSLTTMRLGQYTNFQNFLSPTPNGTCDTDGTSVTALNGSGFTQSMVNGTITINGASYTILSVGANLSDALLNKSAGSQTGVDWSYITASGFALYMTLTPQIGDVIFAVIQHEMGAALLAVAAGIWWNPIFAAPLSALAAALIISANAVPYFTIKDLASPISKDLNFYLTPTASNVLDGNQVGFQDPSLQSTNKITFIYNDYYEDTDLIDIAIQYSRMVPASTCVAVPVFRFVSADGFSYQYRRVQRGGSGYIFQGIAFYVYNNISDSTPTATYTSIYAYSYQGADNVLRFYYGSAAPANPEVQKTQILFNQLPGVAWYAPASGQQAIVCATAFTGASSNIPVFWYGLSSDTVPPSFPSQGRTTADTGFCAASPTP
jgi:hypothetical protein